MSTHNKAKVFLISLSMVTFAVMVVMNGAAGSGAFKGIFQRTVGNISSKYNTNLTPAGWTFFIWNIIYLWQLAWLGYAASGLCRSNELGWFYMKPDVLPTPFYMVWILNNALNVGWLFLWDKEYLSPALLILTGLTGSNYVILSLACRGLHSHRTWLQNHHRIDLCLLRILVQNGIAIYATWTTVATLLNFAVVLVYSVGVANQTSTTVVLSILLMLLVLWFYLENFLLDKYVRYILTVYPVVMVALSGNIAQHYNTSAPTRNNIFAVVLMAVTSVMFLVRLGLVTCRHRYQPLTMSESLFPGPARLGENLRDAEDDLRKRSYRSQEMEPEHLAMKSF
ncbi:uncharacterized protein LOC114045542 isoform X1 [Vombatus ursinus]|uniref:uncharacterized protein LOC114045542 isoform X1 n=2 Tax=Vombatus ursinus TaxID=29139 RepID=UPI000FFD868C|nr:uncharacterized protein LOC114045542 isoform X1 [Vombatus ursinus]XP_027721421.1 uncharacterized protein LOC114045542 isoform X1 [Vombatus ursinus]XP_027721422.1 uncharacterized protein LOC114045542 isoform X1 [Vombatus ursinus]XP_027721423.1 uncharacterized protein LOC114045542 isoform X1 [Vombatus ursinus]